MRKLSVAALCLQIRLEEADRESWLGERYASYMQEAADGYRRLDELPSSGIAVA